MAGGIDWFRWHHGSVTDPKFQLVAKKAGVRLGDVLVVWAVILESASASADRGSFGGPDFDTLDFLMGVEPGAAQRIFDSMLQRALIHATPCNESATLHATESVAYRVARWEVRQPKRERDVGQPAGDATERALPKSSTERSRERRARLVGDEGMQRHATPSNASNGHATPREEESREEKEKVSKPSASHPPRGGRVARFDEFWLAWPKSERKQDKAKCIAFWKLHGLDQTADAILADVRTKRGTTKWQEGFIEAPLVYLRGRRWEDEVTPDDGKPGEAVFNWWSNSGGIRRKGIELGVGDWSEAEQFGPYRARVFAKAGPGPWSTPPPAGLPGVLKTLEPA